MSNLLEEGQFFMVRPALVRALGGNAVDALTLQCLAFWLERSSNEYDGHTWVYNTYQDWADKLGISYSQARTSLARLQKLKVVIYEKPRAGGFNSDHTKWYRIDFSHPIITGESDTCEISQLGLSDPAIGAARSDNSTSTKREPSVDNSPAPAAPSPRGSSRATATATATANPLPLEAAAAPSPVTEVTSKVTVSDEADKVTSPAKRKVKKAAAARKEDREPSPEVEALVGLFVETYNAQPDNVPVTSGGASWNKPFRVMMAPYIPGDTWTYEQIERSMLYALQDRRFWSGVVHSPEDLKRNMRKIEKESRTKQGPPLGRGDKTLDDIARVRQELARGSS